MFPTPCVLAYFSPETMLPLSSLIATIVGCGLLIKRSSIRFLAQCCRAAIRTGRAKSNLGSPHFAARPRRRTQKTRS
jgi:hypothetical protein